MAVRARKQIKLAPQEGMQTAVLESTVTEILMGGQAGPGKSWTLLFADIPDLLKYPDLRVLILRRQSPDLGKLLEDAYEMYSPLGAQFTSRDAYYKKAVFTFPNGSKVIFGHCQHEKDKLKYSGFEFQRLKFDEVTQFTESQYLFLFSRVRTVNKEIKLGVMSSCNPNGIGMLWVKRRFVESLRPGEIKSYKRIKGVDTVVPYGTKDSMTRQWLPGDRKENIHIGDDYETMLSQLDYRDYKALKLGLWEFTDQDGQLISSKWLDYAFSGNVKALLGSAAKKPAIGCDFAHEGQDRSVIFSGKGNRVLRGKYWPQTRTSQFARHIWDEMHIYGKDNCNVGVDSIGPGVGVGDELEDHYKVKNLQRCVHKDPVYDQKWKGAYKFDNLRSQMAWKLRQDFEAKNIDLSHFNDPKLKEDEIFDKISELQEEILSMTYQVRNGSIVVISKNELRKPDNLGRSPDFFDALMIWNWVRDRKMSKVDVAREEIVEVDDYMKNFFEDDEEEDPIYFF